MYFLSSLLAGAVLGVVVLGIAVIVLFSELRTLEEYVLMKLRNINKRLNNE